MFLILGPQKAKMVKSIIEDPSTLPAARVAPVDGELFFLLDRDAASALTPPENFVHFDEGIMIEK